MRKTILLLLALTVAAAGPLAAQVSMDLLNLQGRLTDAAGAPVTGSYNFTVRIYSVATGGSALFSQDRKSTRLNSSH